MDKKVNIVVFDGDTLVDLTSDTVVADKLLAGYTAHNSAGQVISGTCDFNANTSSDTVVADKLTSGYTAHDANGQAITGTKQSITVNSLSVTENGIYTAPTGTAYNPVTVNVIAPRNVIGKANFSNGVVSKITNTSDLHLSDITEISNKSLSFWLSNNVDISGAVDFSNLISIEKEGLYHAFAGCRGITSVSFPELTSLYSNALENCFAYCSISGVISFPKLSNLNGTYILYNMFNECVNIREIHFKLSIQAAIEAQASYNTKFGATNATIYFDL